MSIFSGLRLLTILTISFIAFTAIGTLCHEYGHVIMAKILGYETTLHYGSMEFDDSKLINTIKTLESINKESNKVQNLKQIHWLHNILIAAAGPLQTILTGSIGFFLLLSYNRNKTPKPPTFFEWVLVFSTLFWLRQVFNWINSILTEIITPDGSYFTGDEKKIAELLGIWPGTIATILGLVGSAVCFWVVFKFMPKNRRLVFILSGILGAPLGYILWMKILGPSVLP